MTERGAGRPPGSTYWLIAKNENGRMEMLTICLPDGEEALPVFSFREGAEAFLGLGGFGSGWRVKESRAGELVSVLMGPCAGVGRVALDPLPETVARKTVELLSLDRERFMRNLLGERELTGGRGEKIPGETAEEIAIPDYVMRDFGCEGGRE